MSTISDLDIVFRWISIIIKYFVRNYQIALFLMFLMALNEPDKFKPLFWGSVTVFAFYYKYRKPRTLKKQQSPIVNINNKIINMTSNVLDKKLSHQRKKTD